MNTCILKAVWLIRDDSLALSDLINEATGVVEPVDQMSGFRNLGDLARQAHVHLIGPPRWDTGRAIDEPGWAAYAPARVLIARAPAIPIARSATESGAAA